jgi:hypothetical protein
MLLFPNPTTDHLYLRAKTAYADPIFLQLWDTQGRLLNTWNIPALTPDQDYPLDLSPYPAGNYLLQLQVGGMKQAYPFIRQ